MKIISLQAENFKKLHAIEITPDGNFVQITGRNGQGKSSTLDAIWVALAGIGVAPKKPIRTGAESAKIRLDLGEIIVTRHFKAAEDNTYTTQLTVESAEGARYPSPQKMLDTLLGALSFDPLAFSRMDAKAQFDALRKFVPGVDFDAIDRAQAGDYQKRTEVNRRHKDVKAVADQIKVADTAPVKPVDESALVAKLKDAGDHNADVERRKGNRGALAAQIANDESKCDVYKGDIADLEEKLEDMKEILKNSLIDVDEKKAKLAAAPPLPEVIDTAVVVAQLSEARANNERHAKWTDERNRRVLALDAAKALATESEELTKRMEKRLKDKQAAIAAAKLPIAGISFGEGTVLLGDVPFDQASDAEKLRASVEMAMAANPKLRVIRIRDGSLLDEEGLKLVAEMADTRDCQVWLERVDGSGKVGIVLENGSIKEHADGN
jgi:hypothetical protein